MPTAVRSHLHRLGRSDSSIYLGGIWRTSDAGRTWSSVDDALPSMYISAMARSPLDPNTLYAATGVRDQIAGTGILQSHDRGATWALTHFPGIANFTAGASRLAFTADGNAL